MTLLSRGLIHKLDIVFNKPRLVPAESAAIIDA
jgi:hypothetical protein